MNNLEKGCLMGVVTGTITAVSSSLVCAALNQDPIHFGEKVVCCASSISSQICPIFIFTGCMLTVLSALGYACAHLFY